MKTRVESRDEETVLEAKQYSLMEIRKGDVALDLGGNIGAFGRMAVDAGAEVFAYEPEPFNAKMYAVNVPEAEVFRYAIAAEEGERELFLRKSTSHSIVRGRGKIPKHITVQTATLGGVIKQHDPTVLKVDVEGAEYELNWSSLRGSRVRELAIEFHGNKDSDLERMDAICEDLEKMGYNLLRSAETGAWGGYFVRIYSRARKVEKKKTELRRGPGRPPKRKEKTLIDTMEGVAIVALGASCAGLLIGAAIGFWPTVALLVTLSLAYELFSLGRRFPRS